MLRSEKKSINGQITTAKSSTQNTRNNFSLLVYFLWGIEGKGHRMFSESV